MNINTHISIPLDNFQTLLKDHMYTIEKFVKEAYMQGVTDGRKEMYNRIHKYEEDNIEIVSHMMRQAEKGKAKIKLSGSFNYPELMESLEIDRRPGLLNPPDIVFLDLETTGLNTSSDAIVQIAMIKHRWNQEGAIGFYANVNPGRHIPEESTAIHGINDDAVAREEKLDMIAPYIYAFVKDCVIVGYNIHQFDLPLLKADLARNGFERSLKYHWSYDIATMHSTMIGNGRHVKLDTCYKYWCRKNRKHQHDAVYDAYHCYEIIKAISERNPEHLLLSKEDVCQQSLGKGTNPGPYWDHHSYMVKHDIVLWNSGLWY
jgi:DNA polymerase III subunit epsilon